VHDAWNSWADIWAPRSDNVQDYHQQLLDKGQSIHMPLKIILLSKSIKITDHGWDEDKLNATIIQPDFEWPEVFALATNSVVSEFNPTPLEPRMYSTNDDELAQYLTFYHNKTAEYYDVTLNSKERNVLVAMSKHMVLYDGCNVTLPGVV
jgi:hypothetical protein